MEHLEKQVLDTIRAHHMIETGSHVLAAVSGGRDSVCLLLALYALREILDCRLSVVHVHHGIRTEAGEDEAFVRSLAERLELPCYAEHVDVPALKREWRVSLEEAARRARYEAFVRVLAKSGADRVALAHQQEDQAETVLFKLFRGSGLRGFAGMEPLRDGSRNGPFGITLIRPLLFTPRREIDEYLLARGQGFVEDATNASDAYTRNRIRRHILPYAEEEICRGAAAHLAQAASRAGEVLDFVDRECRSRLEKIRMDAADGEVCLRTDLLCAEDAWMQKEILHAALREAGVTQQIGSRHLEALFQLVSEGGGSRSLDLPGAVWAERRYDVLRIISSVEPQRTEECGQQKTGDEEIPIPCLQEGETCEILLPGAGVAAVSVLKCMSGEQGAAKGRLPEIPADPCTKWFDCDTITKSLCFRTRRQGDRIDTGAGVHSLKKEMIARKIPVSEREDRWLLAAGDEVLWILGDRRSQSHLVTAATTRILEIRLLAKE